MVRESPLQDVQEGVRERKRGVQGKSFPWFREKSNAAVAMLMVGDEAAHPDHREDLLSRNGCRVMWEDSGKQKSEDVSAISVWEGYFQLCVAGHRQVLWKDASMCVNLGMFGKRTP